MLIAEARLREIIREELSQALLENAGAPSFEEILRDIALGRRNYLQVGSRGPAVTALQSFLKTWFYEIGDFGPEGDGVDGKFGPVTKRAVELYQQDVNDNVLGDLESDTQILEDGIVGPQTAISMLHEVGGDVTGLQIPQTPDQPPALPRQSQDYAEIPAGSTSCPPSKSGSNLYGAPGGGSFVYQLQQFDSANNNWRSSQPTAEQLVWLIENHNIQTVIRLNGNEGKMTMAEEKEICDRLGVVYNEGSSGFIDSHSGYQRGRGYLGSIATVLPILARGNCLIHCRAGADRTGYLIAAYLKEQGSCTDLEALWDYTTSFNGWGGERGLICRPDLHGGNRGYIRYLEGFYPMESWCSAESWRRECLSCRER